MKSYTVVVEQDPEGKWTLTAPALPGYVACGDTQEEVLALAREGIPFHLECLKEEGLPVPDEKGDAKVLLLEIAA
jgi:predicted RNase H-like HicB family nuclease